MNKMKKLLSVLLVVCMVCAMSVGAFAADDTYSITINNSTEGYTYVAYQIFAGDLSEDGETLSNITWGSSITDGNSALTAVKAIALNDGSTPFSDCTSAADVAVVLSGKADNSEIAQAFAETIRTYAASNGTSSNRAEDKTSYTITVSAAGYYLVVNTEVPSGDYAYSDYILEVVDNVSVSPKSTETPTFDKTVGDSEDNDLADNDDATEDYAIGDSVPFTLTATLPDSYSAYTEYKLVFTDTLSNGLTYDENSLTVTAGGETLTADSDYTLTASGQTITVTINDLKTSASAAAAGSTVVVSYTAKLNESATSTESNAAYLTYSNNPNGSSTGTTATDKTYVVTFDVTVNKVDGNNNALTGAEFTLYELVGGSYESTGTVLTANEAGTTFTVDGLAIGTYKLVETKTPDGYNTAADIEFTITAEATESSSGVSITSNLSNNKLSINGTAITTTVVNEAGSTLPSTGGIGTTIFYIVGGVLVLGAAVLLITRKRMGRAE